MVGGGEKEGKKQHLHTLDTAVIIQKSQLSEVLRSEDFGHFEDRNFVGQ